MWKDLSKNSRWHITSDYLNYRYEVKAQLDEFAHKQQALIDLIEEKQKRVADS
jgi:hypothetical protein